MIQQNLVYYRYRVDVAFSEIKKNAIKNVKPGEKECAEINHILQ